MDRDALIDLVLIQIHNDLEGGDLTPVVELLAPLSDERLKAYLPENEEDDRLYTYRVTLKEEAGDKFTLVFDCQAKDACHAEEQALDMYLGAEVVNTTPMED